MIRLKPRLETQLTENRRGKGVIARIVRWRTRNGCRGYYVHTRRSRWP